MGKDKPYERGLRHSCGYEDTRGEYSEIHVKCWKVDGPEMVANSLDVLTISNEGDVAKDLTASSLDHPRVPMNLAQKLAFLFGEIRYNLIPNVKGQGVAVGHCYSRIPSFARRNCGGEGGEMGSGETIAVLLIDGLTRFSDRVPLPYPGMDSETPTGHRPGKFTIRRRMQPYKHIQLCNTMYTYNNDSF